MGADPDAGWGLTPSTGSPARSLATRNKNRTIPFWIGEAWTLGPGGPPSSVTGGGPRRVVSPSARSP